MTPDIDDDPVREPGDLLSDHTERLAGHINAAEYWLHQADIYEFPDPARTECLQLAGIHAALAQALSAAQRLAGEREDQGA